VVSNIVVDGNPIGSQDAGLFWHSDLCYLKEPSRGSLFYALEVPHDENGQPLGDTKFASSTAAYNALPESTRQKISGRKAVQSYAKGYYRERNAGPRPPLTEEQKRRTPDVEHPIVRTHPYTGKKCLFVNEGYTARIAGMDSTEGDALLNELIAHSTKPEFIYRHQWQVGDFLIWDNCLVQHQAVPDYKLPLRRHMERTTLTGTIPY
jgi:taurine dioxygenase